MSKATGSVKRNARWIRQHGMSLVELMVTTAMGSVVLLALVSLLFSFARDKDVAAVSSAVEETRRIVQLSLQTRVRDALNMDVWLSSENVTALGIPLHATKAKALPSGLYPPAIVFRNKVITDTGLADEADSDVLFFVSKDVGVEALVLVDDISGTPAFSDSPYLYRLDTAAPYVYAAKALEPRYRPNDLLYFGTPAGAVLSRIVSKATTRVNVQLTGLGTFMTPDPSAAPVRFVATGMFLGRAVVFAAGKHRDTREYVTVRIDPNVPGEAWAIKDRIGLDIIHMKFDPGSERPDAASPMVPDVLLFDPGDRGHVVSFDLRRILLTGIQTQATESVKAEYITREFNLTVSL